MRSALRRTSIRDLSDVAGLALWLRSDRGVVGSPISRWEDLSGRGNHAVQATGGAQPTRAVDALGRPVVRLSSAQYLVIPHSTTLEPGTGMAVYLVLRSSSASVAGAAALAKWHPSVAANSNWGIFGNNAGTAANGIAYINEVGTNTFRPSTIAADCTDGTVHVIGLRWSGSQMVGFRDGVAYTPVACAGAKTTPLSDLVIGRRDAGSSTTYCDGDYYEIAIVNRYIAQGSAEDVAIRSYLRAQQGAP